MYWACRCSKWIAGGKKNTARVLWSMSRLLSPAARAGPPRPINARAPPPRAPHWRVLLAGSPLARRARRTLAGRSPRLARARRIPRVDCV